MKKTGCILISLILVISLQSAGLRAQNLPVPVVYQERSQWCWAAVSESILRYKGHHHSQCNIAEYTRSVATWHNYGSVHCCHGGCNHWNYIQGLAGSIEDILLHFGQLNTVFSMPALPLHSIEDEIRADRPFVIRWGWKTGGGHFVVGHGISGQTIMYMDPMYGAMIGSYSWMVNGPNHNWTSSLALDIWVGSSDPYHTESGRDKRHPAGFSVYPNPATEFIKVELDRAENEFAGFSLFNMQGQLIVDHLIEYPEETGYGIRVSEVPPGIYLLVVKGEGRYSPKKVVIAGR